MPQTAKYLQETWQTDATQCESIYIINVLFSQLCFFGRQVINREKNDTFETCKMSLRARTRISIHQVA